MNHLSPLPAIVVLTVILSLVGMTIAGQVDGNVTVPVIVAFASNALGYVNGKNVAAKDAAGIAAVLAANTAEAARVVAVQNAADLQEAKTTT